MVETLTKIEVPDNFVDLLEANPQKVIDGALEVIFGSQPHWPITTFAVFHLCRSFGFDCSPARLAFLFKNGQVPEPGQFGVELVWQIRHVQALLAYLDENRLWLPGFHAHRVTTEDLQRQQARRERTEYYRTLPVEELRRRLAESGDEDLCEVLHTVLIEKEAE